MPLLIAVGGGAIGLLLVGVLLFALLSGDGNGEAGSRSATDVAEGQGKGSASDSSTGPVLGGPIGEWSVQIDPVPDAWGMPSAASVEIPVHDTEIMFPATPSRFVAVGRNVGSQGVRKIWDMGTCSVVGQIQGPLTTSANTTTSRFEAMSPDGRLFAVKHKPVGIWSSETGQRIAAIEVPAKLTLEMVDFCGTDHLVTGTGVDLRNIAVWDINRGKRLHEIVVPGHKRGRKRAFSPGRRYLALTGESLRIYDLSSGKLAGELPLPEGWRCDVLSFSPEGDELVGFFNELTKARLACWNVSNGSVAVQHIYDQSWHTVMGTGIVGSSSRVDWVGGRRGWIAIGYRVSSALDRESGEQVWKTERRGIAEEPKRLLPGGRLLVKMREGINTVLRTTELPIGQLDATAKIVATGGDPIDATLPPLTSVTSTMPRQIQLQDSVAWSARPDPAGVATLASSTIRPIVLGREPFKGVAFASETPHAVLNFGSSAKSGASSRDGAKPPAFLDRYDLSIGQRLTRTEIPGEAQLIDASPSGETAVTVVGGDRSRLDIWSLVQGQHLVGFRPYQHASMATGRKGRSSSERTVAWARLCDDRHLLTRNRDGNRIVLWRLPEAEPVYSIELQSEGSSFVSPARNYMVVVDGPSVRFLDSLTGQPRGNLALPMAEIGDDVDEGEFAFDAAGRQLVVKTYGGSYSLMTWDLGSGKRGPEIPAPGGALHWSDDRHLLATWRNGQLMIDVNRAIVVWRYALEGAQRLKATPYRFLWASFSDQRLGGVLAPFSIDNQQALERVESELPANQPPLVGPGATVSLDVRIGQGNPKDVEQALRGSLQARNMRVAANAPVRLEATTETGKSRTTSYTQRQGGQTPDIKITITPVVCRLAFVDKQTNRTLWEQKSTVSGSLSYIEEAPKENAAAFLQDKARQNQQGSIPSRFGGMRLPRILRRHPTHGQGELGLDTTTIQVASQVDLSS